jgi:hypothetical protein
LAAAAAAMGNFADAVKYQQLAISMLGRDDRKTELSGMEQRLQQYSSGRAFTSI